MSGIHALIEDYESHDDENKEVVAQVLRVVMKIPAISITLSSLTADEIDTLNKDIKDALRHVRELHKWDNYITPYD